MTGITHHALERAMERYGFTPDQSEVAQILADCKTGIAPCLRKNDMGRVHVCKVRGKLMVVSLALDAPLIVTVLDRSYFNAGSRLQHHQRTYQAKQRSGTSSVAEKTEYRRGRWKAETRNAGEGE